MQPQQNPLPTDYLDQIAPVQQRPGLGKKMLLLIGGVLLLVIIVLVMMIMSSLAPKTETNLTKLALHMQTLQAISEDAQSNIKSSQLQTINSNLTTYLTNANRDIAEPLKTNKINLKKPPKKLVKAEGAASEELSQTLEDARLNAVFDDTYVREMKYQLKVLSLSMKSIYKSTKSRSLKAFLEDTSAYMEKIYKQLDDYKPPKSGIDFSTS